MRNRRNLRPLLVGSGFQCKPRLRLEGVLLEPERDFETVKVGWMFPFVVS